MHGATIKMFSIHCYYTHYKSLFPLIKLHFFSQTQDMFVLIQIVALKFGLHVSACT